MVSEIWDCPICKTVHRVKPDKIRICVCGTRRLLDGTIVEHDLRGELPDSEEVKDGITGRVLRWGRAVARWIRHGRPVRSNEQVEALYAICESCNVFDRKKSICTICDCNVNLSTHATLNKLLMATESCPLGKWDVSVPLKQKIKTPCGSCGRRRKRRKRRRERRRKAD